MLYLDNSGLEYILYQDNHTAEVYSLKKDIEKITIPREIEYENSKYLITQVLDNSFNELIQGHKIYHIAFAEDSSVVSIGPKAFCSSSLKSLFIPASVKHLGFCWCEEANNITDIKISPNNPNFIYFEEKMILGKSDEKSEVYDILYLARRDITNVKIPSFIKYIASSAFDGCCEIKEFLIDEDSELLSVDRCAFSTSSIKKLLIPSKFDEFKEAWCEDTVNLEVDVSPKNKKFIKNKDSLILGKSDLNSNVYDVAYFAPRTIENVVIPSFIKNLNSYAFDNCSHIQSFEFEENSQLISFGNYCLYGSTVRKIVVPASVRVIGSSAFKDSSIYEIEFPDNSQLEIIMESAFNDSQLFKIRFPESLTRICANVFNNSHLNFVGFPLNSKLKIIDINAFAFCSFESILIPSSVDLICSNAFYSCSLEIAEIYDLTNEVKTINIGIYAFFDLDLNFALFVPVNIKILFVNDYDEEEDELMHYF